MLTQEQVRELFDYDRATGKLIWRVRKGTRAYPGQEAGGIKDNRDDKKRYRRLHIDGKPYMTHRIIWLHVYGYMPDEVDHEDGNGLNNLLDNLSESERNGNARNKRLHKRNTSGQSGVYFHKKTERWVAKICENSKWVYLGIYSTLREAIAVRKKAEKDYGYHENHGEVRPL